MTSPTKNHPIWLILPGWLVTSLVVVLLVVGPGNYDMDPETVGWLILQGTFLFTGCLILANRPGDNVGRLLLTAGLTFAAAWVLFPLDQAAADSGNPDFAGAIEAVLNASGTVWVPLLATALLLFPDGMFPTSRWRPVKYLMWATVALSLLAPLANGGWGGDQSTVIYPAPWSEAIAPVGKILALGFFIAEGLAIIIAAAGVVFRFRRSLGVERIQMKWLAFSGLLILIWAPIILIQTAGGAATGWDAVVDSVIFMTIPVAMALAIIRYGLYEIDRLISRTVGYALVLIPLALVYALGAIWVPTRLIGDEVPPVFVAGSTLAVIAMFSPLRSRALNWVDRRFYRSRYDKQKVIDEFGAQLRDEVDMDQITSGLVEVVTRTMRPSSVGVWYRT